MSKNWKGVEKTASRENSEKPDGPDPTGQRVNTHARKGVHGKKKKRREKKVIAIGEKGPTLGRKLLKGG